jgi:hypothetical protein
MGRKNYAIMLPKTVAESVGKLEGDNRSGEEERERTVRNSKEWG